MGVLMRVCGEVYLTYLVSKSGSSNFMDKSNRDNSAASKSLRRLVAHINRLLLFPLNPSIR